VQEINFDDMYEESLKRKEEIEKLKRQEEIKD